jgi:hypothetical protein
MTNFFTISTFFFKTSKKKIFFICNILGLTFACLIIFIYGGKFKSKVIINYPSQNNFLLHTQIKKLLPLEDFFLLHDQYKIIFNKNFLSNRNLNEFINNKKNNNLLLQKFGNNIKVIKKLPFNSDNGEFFLVFDKGVDGKELFINYIDYIKKKTIEDLFIEYRQLILLNIQNREEFLKDSENRLKNIVNSELMENYDIQRLIYYEIVILDKELKDLKKVYSAYDIGKFDYIIYEDLPSAPSHLYYSNYSIIFFGLMFGSLLFLVIIFLNSSAVNKKNIFSLENNL